LEFPGFSDGMSAELVVGTPESPDTTTIIADYFRSGVITLPAESPQAGSPTGSAATVTYIPLTPGSQTFSEINSAAAQAMALQKSQGTLPTIPIPTEIQAILGGLSVGAILPQNMTVTGVTVGAAPVGSASQTAQVQITGTISVTEAYIFNTAYNFTYTLLVAMSPSHDGSNTGDLLTLTGSSPVFTCQDVPSAITAQVAPSMLSQVVSGLQAQFNALLVQAATSQLSENGRALTSTAVLSVQSVGVSSSGISLSLVIGDIFQGGWVSLLSVAMEPQPLFGVETAYTITVKGNGQALAGAEVSINPGLVPTKTNNYGVVQATMKLTNTTLVYNPKLGMVSVYTPPVLSVTAAGFQGYTQVLK
jgi:hypothetical protein